jgi:hypothetical protein
VRRSAYAMSILLTVLLLSFVGSRAATASTAVTYLHGHVFYVPASDESSWFNYTAGFATRTQNTLYHSTSSNSSWFIFTAAAAQPAAVEAQLGAQGRIHALTTGIVATATQMRSR